MWISINQTCVIPDPDTLWELAGRNLVLQQYPHGADWPLRTWTELKSGCMEEDVGVFVWEKGEVTM